MKTKAWLAAVLGAASLTLSSGALAQQSTGWYVGADIGNAEINNGPDDTAWRLVGGYQFNRNLAAEVGYSSLLDKDGVEATALELVAVGMFPIANRFSVFGKVGFANVEVESAAGSDDKTELTYGVGVQYDFSPRLGLRGQWQRYDTENEVDVLSVGVVYKF